ncbi:MAG: hypothetical protein JW713_05885 [Pontiellaceae bacterium]|nr:hypothetical protein [Pontiellaceae bacterium]
MRVTQDLIDKLVDYKLEQKITNAELANRLGCSRAHVGRILTPGSISEVKGDMEAAIKALLGDDIAEDVASLTAPRELFEIRYKGSAMIPSVDKGQTLMAEPVIATELHDNELVVCCYESADGEHVVLGNFRRMSNGYRISFAPEYEPVNFTFSKLIWIARVLRPLRSINVTF